MTDTPRQGQPRRGQRDPRGPPPRGQASLGIAPQRPAHPASPPGRPARARPAKPRVASGIGPSRRVGQRTQPRARPQGGAEPTEANSERRIPRRRGVVICVGITTDRRRRLPSRALWRSRARRMKLSISSAGGVFDLVAREPCPHQRSTDATKPGDTTPGSWVRPGA